MQKILNIISVISFVLVAAITGGGVFSYFWLTNETNQEKLKQQLIEQVTGSLKLQIFLALFFQLQNLQHCLSFDRDSQNRS